MKTNEFIQIVNATSYLTSRNVKLSDIVLQIDTLRKLHARFQSWCEYLLLDEISFNSENEKQKIKNCATEIREFANENNIVVTFEKFGNDYIEFSKKFRNEKKFASYWYRSNEITNLISFVEKKRMKFKNKKIQAISELSLETDFSVLDENGTDINKIPGVDL